MLAIETVRAAMRAHGINVPDTKTSWRQRCPAHDGKRNSLAVKRGDRCVLLKCHSKGCRPEQIAASVGLSMDQLRDDTPGSHRATTTSGHTSFRDVDIYPYRDEAGEVLFEVVRQEQGERLPGKKPIKRFQVRVTRGRRYLYSLDGVRRVLFDLPEVIEAIAEEKIVLVVEGEKAVRAAARLGYVATTNFGGAGNWAKDGVDSYGYSESLRGANVCLLPDNDEPGVGHMLDLGRSLQKVGADVRVVRLPELPPKGDLCDWIDAGGTATALGRLIEDAVLFGEWERELLDAASPLPMPKRLLDVSQEAGPEFLVEELLVAGEISWFGGHDGVMKSALALHLSAAVAVGGRAFRRFQTKKGPVLFVSGEDPEGIIRNRVEAMCAGESWDLRHALENIHALALSGLDMSDEAWRAALKAYVANIRPVLIVLDPLFELISGDENSNTEARVVVRLLRELTTICGSTVIVVHHFKKPSEGARKADLFRGANAPLKASRQTYAIDQDSDGVLVVECLKFSRGAIRGTVREKFSVVPHIETAHGQETDWRFAQFAYQGTASRAKEKASDAIRSVLSGGQRRGSDEIKKALRGKGISATVLSSTLRTLEQAGEISFQRGNRGKKLWGLTESDSDAEQAEQP